MPIIQGDISEVNANLVGLWLQLLATGAYIVYLPHCAIILTRKLRQGLSRWLPAVCLLIFAATMLDVVTGLVMAYDAFAIQGDGEVPDPNVIYGNPSSKLSLMKNAMNIVVAILSDIIIVYRTYIVWNLNIWAILTPVGLLASDTALGIWAVWTLAQTMPGNDISATVTLRVRYFFIITFVLNVLCSGMICYKIWRVQSLFPREFSGRGSYTGRILEIIGQSAIIYCAHLLILIITNCMGTNYFFMFIVPLPPVGAYVFSMIIVRAQESISKRRLAAPPASLRFSSATSPRVPTEIALENVSDSEGEDVPRSREARVSSNGGNASPKEGV
ncbi:hypothetical protein C8Q73DRAFT_659099 [Cubamyces lactineus]|nr:hypothetical protein C8Q73DRAFT_659099 [Cubamyces lactineus]